MQKSSWQIALKHLSSGIDRYVGALSGQVISWLIFPLIGIICYEVFCRYVLHSPTVWVYDMSYFLYSSHFMLGAAYTLYRGMHIRMDVYYGHFTLRKKGLIDSFMYLFLFFPGIYFFMLVGWESASSSWANQEVTSSGVWHAPLYILKMVVPIAALLLLAQGLSEFLKSMHRALTGEEL